jgi:hypothetical protein
MKVQRLTALLCAASFGLCAQQVHPDHHEFEAALHAPFQSQSAGRDIALSFHFVDAAEGTLAVWHLELVDARGRMVREWRGESALNRGEGGLRMTWDGRDASGKVAPQGFYTLRLRAADAPMDTYFRLSGTQDRRVNGWLAQPGLAVEEQESTFCVGAVPRLRVRTLDEVSLASKGPKGASRLAQTMAAAPSGLPYTTYFGNLHSQTNHSDGGQAVGVCAGAETPQGGTQGPSDAFEMMRVQAGGDFLLASEHNHMYDGSTGTNTALSPTDPNYGSQLFARGLGLATSYRAAHPEFLALYGMEWGVISNGGHLNILNPDGLATWESNASGQLLGDVFTPKSDYPSLYTVMRGRGWIGQFNHPQTSQFGNMVYTADGDAVMMLCEVMNTSAFSTNTTQTETHRSFYEGAFKRLLETGYHVAPSTDQDNHCANWGLSYTNRTGVLIPNGTPLGYDAFMDAVKARRVFATMDKTSQIVLTGNGNLMGQRLANSGTLTLQVAYSTTTAGRTASQIQLYEGVPGTIGSTALLSDGTDTVTVSPQPGSHFYYAVITQDNGDKLWSAPLWVDQAAGAVSAIISQPSANVTVPTGTSVDFAGSASTIHTGITSTAWTFGDGGTATGNTASHVFTNAGTAPVTYTVSFAATDDQGAVGTATRLVTVTPAGATNTPPTLTAFGNQSITRNGVVGPLAFTIGDAETPAALLTVTATSSNQALIPDANLVLDGVDAARTLTLTPAADQTGTATITVTVTDAAGASTSRSFQVSVGATGQAKLIISEYYEGLSNNKWLEITNVGSGVYDATVSPLYLGSWFNPFTNGTTYSVMLIPGQLGPGASLTVKNASSALPLAANVTGTPIANTAVANFNGDDITYITTVNAANASAYAARVDVIGENSAFWATSVSGGYGKDTIFVRNYGINAPNATFNVNEWTKMALDQADNAPTGYSQRLGEHSFNHVPVISDIPSQTAISGTAIPPIPFTLTDDQSVEGMAVTVTTSNPTLLPRTNITMDGFSANRTITLVPVADQLGSATVTLSVTDAFGATSSTSFVLTVQAPPITITHVTVTPASITLPPGGTWAFSSLVEGTGSFSSAVNWATNGGLIDGTGHYQAPLLEGSYAVTATSVQDPTFVGQSTVTVFNAPPAAFDQTLELDEDTPLNVTLTGQDPEGAPMSFAVLQAPVHGHLTGTAPALTYVPDANYNGPDAFTFTVSDGSKVSAAATVRLTVRPVNDAPVAQSQALSTPEDSPLAITLAGSDVDGDALGFAVVQAPQHGQLTGTAPNLTYVPDPNYNGSDSFTFLVSDASLASTPATVTLDVTPVNDPPAALPLVVSTFEDTPVSVTLAGTDTDGNALTYTVLQAPAHGTLTGVAPNLTYVPNAGVSGQDSFIYTVNDGTVDSAPAVVGVIITAVNHAPVAMPQVLSTNEDTPLSVVLSATDHEGDALSYSVVQAPAHGTLTGTGANLTYVPAANFNGTDSFIFKANDGKVDSAPATVSIAVAAVNDAPVATSQNLVMRKNSVLPIQLTGTDAEGSKLKVKVLSHPRHGLLFPIGRTWFYLPFPGFTGADAFTFKVNDGQLDSAPATVSITVEGCHPHH